MDDTISIVTENLDKADITGTILHIGAGCGAQVDTWLATAASHICLVEPDPQFFRALKEKAANEPRLNVIAAAVASEAGTAVLNVCNLSVLSSLREPEGLLDLFPGLRIRDLPRVSVLTVAELVTGLPGLTENGNLLVVEAPGEEEVILKGLVATDMLSRFSRIILHCGADALYKGGVAAADLVAILIGQGFRQAATGGDDSDFMTSLFVLDRDVLERRKLQAQVEATERRAAELQQQLDEANNASLLKTSLVEQLQAALAEMTGTATGRDKRVKELEAESARQAADHKDIVAKFEWRGKRIKELEAKVAEQAAEREDLGPKFEWRGKRIKELEAKVAEQAVRYEDIGAKVEWRGKHITALESKIAEQAAQAETDRATQSGQIVLLETAVAERDIALEAGAAEAWQQAERLAALEAEVENLHTAAVAKAERIAALETELAGCIPLASHNERVGTVKRMLAERDTVLETRAAEARQQAERLAALEAEVENLHAAAAAKAERIAALETELTACIPLATHNQRVGAVKRTVAERDAALETAATDARQQAKRLAALGSELESLRTAADHSSKRVAELEAKVAQQAAARKEIEAEAARRTNRINELEAEVGARNEDVTDLARRLDELKAIHQQETILSMRMLALRDADLADLRMRHSRLDEEKNEQDLLLQTLTIRLTEASRHLQQLETEATHRVIPAGNMAEDEHPPAKPKRKSKKSRK